MDTGKTIDNFKFYEGFEGEPEIVIKAENSDMQILHIWDGYFDDILREPKLDGNGWQGFTRDYHQGTENVSRLAPNKQLAFSRDLCPMFMLNVSFNLSFGKQKQMATKRIDNSDKDTGILTGTK